MYRRNLVLLSESISHNFSSPIFKCHKATALSIIILDSDQKLWNEMKKIVKVFAIFFLYFIDIIH